MKGHPEFYPWFVGIWIVLMILGFWFYFSKNIELKKRWFPIFMVGGGVLFVGFVLLLSGQPMFLIIVIPGVTLITYLNIRNTKFCESCGRTVYNHMWFSKIEYCAKCGAKLP